MPQTDFYIVKQAKRLYTSWLVQSHWTKTDTPDIVKPHIVKQGSYRCRNTWNSTRCMFSPSPADLRQDQILGSVGVASVTSRIIDSLEAFSPKVLDNSAGFRLKLPHGDYVWENEIQYPCYMTLTLDEDFHNRLL